MEIFTYQAELHKQASQSAGLSGKSWADFFGGHLESGKPVNHEALFYGLMACRKGVFPGVDVCLLAANIVASMDVKTIRLLDWSLLPSAVLLAGQGRKIVFPDADPYGIKPYLEKLLPGVDGNSADCLFLGADPITWYRKDPRFLDKVGRSRGAIFFCGWDFLGYDAYEPTRKAIVDAKLLYAALQLPKLRGDTSYPALVVLSRDSFEAHLTQISTRSSVVGSLDQGACLRALGENAVSLEAIADNGYVFRAFQEAPVGQDNDFQVLSQFADVFRCLVRRRKADDAVELGADEFVAGEIGLVDIDPLTGFVANEIAGKTIITFADSSGKRKDDFIKKGDILLAFRGAVPTLGKVGLVVEYLKLAIPNLNFCIVRPKRGVSAFWLFHLLQRPEIKKLLAASASGVTTLITSLKTIRDIPVYARDKELIEEVDRVYAGVLEKYKEVGRIRSAIHDALVELNQE